MLRYACPSSEASLLAHMAILMYACPPGVQVLEAAARVADIERLVPVVFSLRSQATVSLDSLSLATPLDVSGGGGEGATAAAAATAGVEEDSGAGLEGASLVFFPRLSPAACCRKLLENEALVQRVGPYLHIPYIHACVPAIWLRWANKHTST